MLARPPHESNWPGHWFAFKLLLACLLVGVSIMALSIRSASLPPEASGKMLIVFQPGESQDAMFAAITRAGGRPIRTTWLDFVWIATSPSQGFAGRMRSEGAIGTYRETPFSPQLAGCFAFVDAKTVELFTLRH